jgi:hypothetical protein
MPGFSAGSASTCRNSRAPIGQVFGRHSVAQARLHAARSCRHLPPTPCHGCEHETTSARTPT